jgi:hypothetical protein
VVLAAALGQLATPVCLVALDAGDGQHRGAVAVRDRAILLELDGHFSRQRLLPEPLAERSSRVTWLLEPLVLKQRRLGYAMFELGPLDGRVYAALRDHVSAAIAGLLAPG